MVQKLKLLKKSESGIAHLALLLVIVGALSAVGFVGYNLYQKNSSNASGVVNASMCGKGYKYLTSTKISKYGSSYIYVKGQGLSSDWCAFTVRQGDAYGVKGYTRVEMGSASDAGNFKYYAGPVKVSNRSQVYMSVRVDYKDHQDWKNFTVYN